jgi:hypothetical protein
MRHLKPPSRTLLAASLLQREGVKFGLARGGRVLVGFAACFALMPGACALLFALIGDSL